MKYFVAALALLMSALPAKGQQLITSDQGLFYCHGSHPRCSWADQATYPYHQFGGQHAGQMFGFSDLLPNGPPLFHYQTFLTELISQRPDTNAVAFWSDAASVVNGGRVWGGFISARSGLPTGADSQLIGLEIDVLNGGLPGVYPNASKVGLQIVGFGNPNTNAIEITTDTASAAFQNVINIQRNTVAPNGAVIGMAPQSAGRGIDFQGSTFSDGAFIVSPNQKLVFRAPGLGDATIYRDELFNGFLVLQAGPPGLRIVNNQNNTNLLIVTPTGDLITPIGSFSNVLSRLAHIEQGLGAAGSQSVGSAVQATAASAGALQNGAANHGAGVTTLAATSGSIEAGTGATASGTDAIALGDGSVASADDSAAIGHGASATGSNSVALGSGSTDGGEANVVSVGSAAQTRQITNVSAGVRSTDAVNLGQLNNSMNQAITASRAYTDTRFDAVSYDLSQTRMDAEGATASAMALAGIPQSFERGQGMIGMGVGTWQGESAVAVGVSKATDDGRFVLKAGATYNSRNQGGANAGVGWAF